ncbi:MAG: ArsR/SmtB family transcription factor [Thalassospira sp.]|uniref:ArsR/SmtB family transcription factor n=1 Tax=Thalassospira sp. TaxID=1912094 RepID=UPI003A8A2B30
MSIPIDPHLSKVFRALGDDTRLLILDELRKRNDQTLFELCARLFEEHEVTLTRQAITRHLTTLEQAELIQTAWRGRTKIHSFAASVLTGAISPWLEPFFEGDTK